MATPKVTEIKSPLTGQVTSIPATLKRVKRITAKQFAQVKVGPENIVKIAGVINSYRVKTGPSGEYIAFYGAFRCIVGTETTSSDEMLLPVYPEKVLLEEFKHLVGDAKNSEARFAVKLFKKDDSANKNNSRGFTWECEPIVKMSLPDVATDPLLKLLA